MNVKKGFGIKMSLPTTKLDVGPKKAAVKKAAVSAVFNNDSSDDEEEIPAEARYEFMITAPGWVPGERFLFLMARIIAE